ncbi:hypothetical protein D9M70_516640 [compost metagenome]
MARPSIDGQCSKRFTLMRDMPSLKPLPSPPKILARGTRTLSKRISPSICWPDIGTYSLVTVTPGRFRSTSTALIAGGVAVASVTHMTMAKSANGAPLM